MHRTLLPLLLALCTSCDPCGKQDTGPLPDDTGDTDADTDTDADADTDTDTDTDADTDTDMDADADTGETDCALEWFADADADGFGDPATSTSACTAPSGWVGDGTDCDDGDAAVHPGATEVCDGKDNDCDGATPADGVTVDDGTTWATIQDAVDAASPGATLSLCPGTYAENLRIARSVRLVGTGGAASTTLDGGGRGSTIVVTGGDVTLEGLTITGGTGSLMDGQRWGGGVYAAGASGLEVLDCVVEGNTAEFGGGLVGRSRGAASDVITGTVFRNNVATEWGGGFVLFRAILSGVESTGNEAGYGGGGAAFYWDVTADATTTLHDNTAVVAGGGLLLWDEGSWSGGGVEANISGGAGGGIYIADDARLSDVVVSGNLAATFGGGVGVGEARVELDTLSITGNEAANGGGIAFDGAEVALAGCTLEGNVATLEGAGLYLDNRTRLSATDLVAHGQVAGTAGGGAFLAGGELDCATCDFGEGLDENLPDDLAVETVSGTSTWIVGTGATFSCSTTSGTCTGL